jgi:hypothetical protein
MKIAARGRNYELKKLYLFTAENNILLFEMFISPALGLCRPGRQKYKHPSSIHPSSITVTSEHVTLCTIQTLKVAYYFGLCF